MAVATGERQSFTDEVNRQKEKLLQRILENDEVPLQNGTGLL